MTRVKRVHEETDGDETFVVEEVEESSTRDEFQEEEITGNQSERDGVSAETSHIIEDNSFGPDVQPINSRSQSFTSPSQELFAKYVRQENNLKNLQRKHDQLTNEKTVLEKVLKSKDAALVKTTLDFENSVEQLEKLKDALKLKETQIKNLKSEKKSLEEMSSINQLSRKRDTDKNRANAILPEDSLDRIIALENELKLKNNELNSLQNEANTLKKMADKKDKAIETLEEKIKQYEYKHDRVYEIESKNSELTIQLEKASKEIRTLQEISRMKTKTIEKLNDEIEALKNDGEDYKDNIKKNAQVSKEMERLKTELMVAKKSIDKKDKEMHKLVQERDIVPLKSLEGDKRFLQSEIKKHLEKISMLERSLQFNEKKNETLKNRLQSITQALKDTKIEKQLKVSRIQTSADEETESQPEQSDDDKTVPAELYNLLEKTVEELRKVGCERDIALTEKDTVIESLERKIEIMEKSKQTDLKSQKRTIKALQDQLDELNKKVYTSEEQFKEQEKQLKKEALSVKQKLHKTKGIRK